MWTLALISLVASAVLADPTIYFKEEFDDTFRDRWVDSTHKPSEQGEWKHTAGKWYADAEKDKGIQTSQDARFYGISAKFDNPFSNKDKTLVIQFQVKHEQNIDCGGGYVKVYPSTVDQADLHGDSPYHIMFGPDICGYSTKKVHVIFTYKSKNLLTKKEIRCKDDELSHVYTLILKPDNSYIVKIDGKEEEKGELEADFDFLKPKKIKDPDAKKPEDWDEREKIPDPEDKKPEDWEKPQHIPDPEAKKPDDWDDEMDGEWEPPQIDNPEYKGEWKAKEIDNPAYKGKWVHPEIDNPEYEADSNLYLFEDIGAIGFDLWQVKSGSIFDNVLVTDDEDYAAQYIKDTFEVTKAGEQKMKDAHDEEERKKQEEEDKKAKAEGKDDEDKDDDEGADDEDDEDKDEPMPDDEEEKTDEDKPTDEADKTDDKPTEDDSEKDEKHDEL